MKKYLFLSVVLFLLAGSLFAQELPVLTFENGQFVYQGVSYNTVEFFGPQFYASIEAKEVAEIVITPAAQGKIVTIKIKDGTFTQFFTWQIGIVRVKKKTAIAFVLG